MSEEKEVIEFEASVSREDSGATVVTMTLGEKLVIVVGLEDGDMAAEDEEVINFLNSVHAATVMSLLKYGEES